MASFSYLCKELLPILGVIALIFLIIFLFKLIKLIISLDVTVNKTHGSIEMVEKSLDKVQAPLDTAVNVSKHIDDACEATGKAINDAKDYVSKNLDNIKNKVSSFVKKEEKTNDEPDELKEVSLDDILSKGE